MTRRIGVILAGGQSTRMGANDKAEIKLGPKRLIEVVHKRINAQCDEIFLSAAHDYALDISYIPDDITLPGGPAGGVLSVAKTLISCPNSPEGFFTIPVDGPNLPPDFCHAMYSLDRSRIASGPARTHPSFAWWRLEDLNIAIEQVSASESLSLHRLAHLCEAQTVKWLESDLFFNINTANDLSNYLTQTISTDND